MSHRMRARPSRVRRWEGLVREVGNPDEHSADTLWCEFAPADHKGPSLLGEIPRRLLPAAVPGTLFNVYRWRKGRKERYAVRERDLGVWTQEEIDGARARAKELVSLFGTPEVDR